MIKKLNILILSTSHPYKTAGILAFNLMDRMKSRGHYVKLMVKTFDAYNYNGILNYHTSLEVSRFRIIHLFRRIKNKVLRIFNYVRFDPDPEYLVQTLNQRKKLINSKRVLTKIGFVPDAIIVLFTQKFVNFTDLYELQKVTKAPIFFILCDMAIFTGLCHYSWDCINFTSACGTCPAIFSKRSDDISYENLKAKVNYAKKMDITALSWSDWLLEKVKKSAVFDKKPILKIPTIGNKRDFHPISVIQKESIKQRYNIDKNAFVISFGVLDLNQRRKGVKDIIKALNLLKLDTIKEKNIIVIYSGNGILPEKLKTIKAINFGLLGWERLIEFYQISDLYLSASIQDVGPATIIEAMMCGVPVISYDVGIANDYIIDNSTGYLIEVNDYLGLFNGIMTILNKSKNDYLKMRNQCIEISKKFYDENNYEIIETIISNHISNISEND